MTDSGPRHDPVSVPAGESARDRRELLTSYYALVDAGDIDGLVTLFADDIRYERPGQETIEGIDELRRFYERGRPLEDGSHELSRILVEDTSAAVRGTFSGRLDGDPVSFGFADHHEFDADGLITERYTFTDRDSV
ncbi:hypothetical protein C479_13033 [Halovivax asiaticus JCM 14624]|uniref:SnoaL-like domain-containing protein n=1 Tax=Halovivax asiaticus JCM 14624 TaxID=1227490 RepID=M0BF31_9EURY|nr:nuclear transport factor 2 family protein [Halovivax asiaticus]ELZ08264.1 hypothetical protein C479_13033 [Halovivax asiaticus JCM 14624]